MVMSFGSKQETFSIVDINGGCISDVIIGAYNTTPGSRIAAGLAYLIMVWRRKPTEMPTVIHTYPISVSIDRSVMNSIEFQL